MRTVSMFVQCSRVAAVAAAGLLAAGCSTPDPGPMDLAVVVETNRAEGVDLLPTNQIPARPRTPGGEPPARRGGLAGAGPGSVAGETALEGGTLVLSLEGCLELALGRNLALADTRLVPAIRGEDFLLAGEVFEPTLTAGVNYGDVERRTASSQVGAEVLEEETWDGSVGIEKTWGPGTRSDLAWAYTRQENNSEFATVNPTHESILQLQVTQPLLRGFGLDVNRAEIRKAANNRIAAEQEVRMTLESEMLGVIRDYWELVYASADLDLQRASLALAEEQVAITRDQLEAGTASPLDLVSAQASRARQSQDVIRARNAYRKRGDRLIERVRPSTRPADYLLRPIPSTRPGELAEPDKLKDISAAAKQALKERPEAVMAALDVANRGIDTRVARNDRLARLDLVGSVQWQGLDGDRGQALDDSTSGEYPSWRVGAELGWLFDGDVRRARFRRARLLAESARIARQQIEADIITEVRAARYDLETAWNQLAAGRETLRLATEQYEGELDRLKVGRSTVFRTDTFRQSLLEAQQGLLRARIDIYLARAQWLAARGRLADTVFAGLSGE